MLIVDAHEDIAYNVIVHGRDYTFSAQETRAREAGDARTLAETGTCMLGLPEWLAGHVGIIFGTLFTMPAHYKSSGEGAREFAYTTPREAYTQAMQQLDLYTRLAELPAALDRLS